MGLLMVKRKVRIFHILMIAAGLSFLLSATGTLPARVVEYGFSRPVFPTISHIAGIAADALPFSWLDPLVVLAVLFLIIVVRWRLWRALAGTAAAGYLLFFWSWGVNYHRQGIELKLGLEGAQASKVEVDAFTKKVAEELNRLWPMTASASIEQSAIAQKASDRTRTVIARLDGKDWTAASKIKRSWIIDPWFRAAGVEGMFNPIVHEPIVTSRLLNFERPFVMCHELAHVRGYPDEGDANLAALFATLSSDDPLFQYSGWFQLWLYLRTPELDELLDDGPRLDLQLYYLRVQAQQIRWISNFQAAMLDWFLKANDVDEGIRSYARFVTVAVASQNRWEEFR